MYLALAVFYFVEPFCMLSTFDGNLSIAYIHIEKCQFGSHHVQIIKNRSIPREVPFMRVCVCANVIGISALRTNSTRLSNWLDACVWKPDIMHSTEFKMSMLPSVFAIMLKFTQQLYTFSHCTRSRWWVYRVTLNMTFHNYVTNMVTIHTFLLAIYVNKEICWASAEIVGNIVLGKYSNSFC